MNERDGRIMMFRMVLAAERAREEKEMEQWCEDCGRELDPETTKCASCHYADEAMGEGISEGEEHEN